MTIAIEGARLAGDRLGARFVTVSSVLSLTGVALAGILEHRGSPVRAADHTLFGAVFGIAIPLLTYASASRATRGAALERVLDAVGRWGANRRLVAVGFIGALATWGAVASALLAATGVFFARGSADPAFFDDCLTSMRIGAVGGAVYVVFFLVGSLLTRRFWMFVLLAGDWLLGSTTTAVSAPWPRSHLRNLLGAEPVLGMTQGEAFLALAGLVVVCALTSLACTRR